MKDKVMKKDAAKYLKVSVPTLNKFLQQNSGLMLDNLVNLFKLEQAISQKSMGNLKKGGNSK
jgi:hypothetical protein